MKNDNNKINNENNFDSLTQIEGLISLNQNLIDVIKQYKEFYTFSPPFSFSPNEKNITESLDTKKDLFLFEQLFHCSTDAFAVLDQHFNFIIFNEAFKLSFSEIFNAKLNIGMNFIDILFANTELKSQVFSACEKALMGQSEVVKIENDNGEEVYYCYELYFNRIFDFQNNQIHGISINLKNLTEYTLNKHRQLKQHVLFAQEARHHAMGEMAAALAHEINQPISAISIYSRACLEQLKKEKSINTQLMMGMEKIDQLANYAGEIIHRMKNFLRGGELSKEKINMNVLIMQALTFLEHQKRELKFKIILNLAENLPLIWVDAIKIIQVILNLAQNSIEAFQFQKSCFLEIIVESKLINNYIEINIKDNGPGISEKIIDKVTNSYVTTKPQGTGLGLPICRTIIEAHGGELFIQKNNKIGTCICFTLPTLLSDNE